MSEEQNPYTAGPTQRRRDDGVQHIGEILRQFVDEHGWDRRLLPPPSDEAAASRVSGRRRDG